MEVNFEFETEKCDLQRLEWKMAIEAALFMSGGPLSIEVIHKHLPYIPLADIERLIYELRLDYEVNNGALEIGGGMRSGFYFTLKAPLFQYKEVAQFTAGEEFTPTELKTLAFIAFNQPVELQDIIDFMGPSVKKTIKNLLSRNFILEKTSEIEQCDENGKAKKGKIAQLQTSANFAEYLGVPNNIDLIRNKIQEYA